jgi:hypothetical protein
VISANCLWEAEEETELKEEGDEWMNWKKRVGMKGSKDLINECNGSFRDSNTKYFGLFYHLQYSIRIFLVFADGFKFFFWLVVLILFNPHLAKSFVICCCFTEHA